MATVAKTPSLPQEKKIPRSRISTVEWIIVVLGLGILDATQILLAFFLVGIAVDSIGDMLIGGVFFLYLSIRGELSWPASRNRIILALLATFALEFIPILNVAPFWCMDGAFCWNESRKRNRMASTQKKKMIEAAQQVSAIEQRNKIIEFRQKQEMIQERNEQ